MQTPATYSCTFSVMDGIEALERRLASLEQTVVRQQRVVSVLLFVVVAGGGLWLLSSLSGRPSLKVSSIEVIGAGGQTIARIGESHDHQSGAITALSSDGKSQFEATASGYGLSAPSKLR